MKEEVGAGNLNRKRKTAGFLIGAGPRAAELRLMRRPGCQDGHGLARLDVPEYWPADRHCHDNGDGRQHPGIGGTALLCLEAAGTALSVFSCDFGQPAGLLIGCVHWCGAAAAGCSPRFPTFGRFGRVVAADSLTRGSSRKGVLVSRVMERQRHSAPFASLLHQSRKGNCWANAPVEVCFGTLKVEHVHQACGKT